MKIYFYTENTNAKEVLEVNHNKEGYIFEAEGKARTIANKLGKKLAGGYFTVRSEKDKDYNFKDLKIIKVPVNTPYTPDQYELRQGKIFKGKIIKFLGSWGSGIGSLLIKDSKTGQLEQVSCENGQTVRALEACFGNVITNGHTANGEGYKNKEVFWAYDEMGITLGGFTPIEEASEKLVSLYEKRDK